MKILFRDSTHNPKRTTVWDLIFKEKDHMRCHWLRVLGKFFRASTWAFKVSNIIPSEKVSQSLKYKKKFQIPNKLKFIANCTKKS